MNAIRKAREEIGMSQRELAKLSGVPRATLQRIEDGHGTSVDTASAILRIVMERGGRLSYQDFHRHAA